MVHYNGPRNLLSQILVRTLNWNTKDLPLWTPSTEGKRKVEELGIQRCGADSLGTSLKSRVTEGRPCTQLPCTVKACTETFVKTCHLRWLFFSSPPRQSRIVPTNWSTPWSPQKLPSVPLSPCCRCIIVSVRFPQCFECVTCPAVGGPYEDFPGVVHLSFSWSMTCPGQELTFFVLVLATARKRTNFSVLAQYVQAFTTSRLCPVDSERDEHGLTESSASRYD